MKKDEQFKSFLRRTMRDEFENHEDGEKWGIFFGSVYEALRRYMTEAEAMTFSEILLVEMLDWATEEEESYDE